MSLLGYRIRLPISHIRGLPVSIYEIPAGTNGVHESVLRAFSILSVVKRLLEEDAPSVVVLGLIEEMEGA
jgi:hypothetical protein